MRGDKVDIKKIARDYVRLEAQITELLGRKDELANEIDKLMPQVEQYKKEFELAVQEISGKSDSWTALAHILAES